LEISITVRNGHLTEEVQQSIRHKVSRLPKFFDRTTGIQVVADLQHNDTPKVEIIVSAEEVTDFFAADTGVNVLSALDKATNKVEAQLKKHKEKLKGHRNREPKFDVIE
jgi:putative sigma-54 modulation protein